MAKEQTKIDKSIATMFCHVQISWTLFFEHPNTDEIQTANTDTKWHVTNYHQIDDLEPADVDMRCKTKNRSSLIGRS